MWHKSLKVKDGAQIGQVLKDFHWILFLWCSLLLSTTTLGGAGADPRIKRCPPTAPRSSYLKAAPTWEKCYDFRREKRSWRSAHISCLEKKGRLVTIREKRIQRFLVDTMYGLRYGPREIWIGATDRVKEMKWVWVTGEDVSSGYSNWARGQPSCGITCVEDCAIMKWKISGGKWHDYHCSWLKNMAYVCEYDMIPEPKTTTTTTSTTTSTTTPSTSNAPLLPTKALQSEYLVHRNEPVEHKDNTTVVLVQEQVMLGSNSPRVGSAKEETRSSSFGTESLIFLIVGLLTGLSAGFCIFVFLLFHRRRRNKPREEDPSISYSNPYYGEITAKVLDGEEHSSDRGHLLRTEVDEDYHGDLGDMSSPVTASPDTGHDGKIWKNGKVKEYTEEEEMMLGGEGDCGAHGGNLKCPPSGSPLHQRPQYVMNTYDSPPCLAIAKRDKYAANSERKKAADPKGNKHGKDLSKSSSLQPPVRSKNSRLSASRFSNGDGKHYSNSFAAKEENHYDEVGASNFTPPLPPLPPLPPSSCPPVPPLPVFYDVPRSALKKSSTSRVQNQQKKRDDDGLSVTACAAESTATRRPKPAGSTSDHKHKQTHLNMNNGSHFGNAYANFDREENLYESVENLRAAIEQQRHSSNVMSGNEASYPESDSDADDDITNEAAEDIYVTSSRRKEEEEEERYVPFPGDDTYKAMR